MLENILLIVNDIFWSNIALSSNSEILIYAMSKFNILDKYFLVVCGFIILLFAFSLNYLLGLSFYHVFNKISEKSPKQEIIKNNFNLLQNFSSKYKWFLAGLCVIQPHLSKFIIVFLGVSRFKKYSFILLIISIKLSYYIYWIL